jgi:hypothetical protein
MTKMCNLKHKARALQKAFDYLRELHASHHYNEQKWPVQPQLAEKLAAKRKIKFA